MSKEELRIFVTITEPEVDLKIIPNGKKLASHRGHVSQDEIDWIVR